MSLEEKRKRRDKRKAKKAKRLCFGHNPQSDEDGMKAINSLSHNEKAKILDIVNEVGKQWDWSLEDNGMVETPPPDYEEYTMELLETDMAFIGRKLKDLDFDGWLFAILVEKGGTKWAATIFSRFGKNAAGRQWVSWTLNPDFLRQFNKM